MFLILRLTFAIVYFRFDSHNSGFYCIVLFLAREVNFLYPIVVYLPALISFPNLFTSDLLSSWEFAGLLMKVSAMYFF